MPKLLLALYLLFLLAAGWRLFGIGWRRPVKIATAFSLVLPVPLLFLIPAVLDRGKMFADVLLMLGLVLLASGTTCLVAGMAGAWMRARRA